MREGNGLGAGCSSPHRLRAPDRFLKCPTRAGEFIVQSDVFKNQSRFDARATWRTRARKPRDRTGVGLFHPCGVASLPCAGQDTALRRCVVALRRSRRVLASLHCAVQDPPLRCAVRDAALRQAGRDGARATKEARADSTKSLRTRAQAAPSLQPEQIAEFHKKHIAIRLQALRTAWPIGARCVAVAEVDHGARRRQVGEQEVESPARAVECDRA